MVRIFGCNRTVGFDSSGFDSTSTKSRYRKMSLTLAATAGSRDWDILSHNCLSPPRDQSLLSLSDRKPFPQLSQSTHTARLPFCSTNSFGPLPCIVAEEPGSIELPHSVLARFPLLTRPAQPS